MLAWREMREMQHSGINFGAHTLTHPDLTRLPFDRVQAEVCDSKAIIEDALGAPVACFAYPYGRYDHRSREIAWQHFACACSDKLGLVAAGSDPYALERVDAYYLRTDRLFDPYALERVDAYYLRTDRLFDVILTGLFPWYIRARSIPRRIRRAFQGSTGRWTDHFAFV
jgi:peptidoglycan/xylan/chitin deacetylase (PgdA/CDA1 family)